MTARPEFTPPWPSELAFAELRLSRLDGEAVGEFMAAILSGRELSRAVLAQVAERAAGVPLFIEETLKMVLEGEPAGATTIPGTPESARRTPRRAG